jgi:FecR protein
MKKKNLIMLFILVMAVLVMSPAWSPQDGNRDIQAILIKVINNVEKNAPTKGWTKAVSFDQLKSGYEIRTQPKSIAVIKFQDNSKLVVREKSIAQIKGQAQGRQILDRQVHMTRGNIRFSVTKGEKEQFRFTSPISVASIRGTSGDWGQTDSLSQYVMLTGLLNLLNLNSNRSDDVGAGQTGITDINGNLIVRPSTDDEKTNANQTDEETTKTKHELRIKGEDKDGKERTIILKWEE